MNRSSGATSCPPTVPGDGHSSGHGRSECRRVCSNCRKVLRQFCSVDPEDSILEKFRTNTVTKFFCLDCVFKALYCIFKACVFQSFDLYRYCLLYQFLPSIIVCVKISLYFSRLSLLPSLYSYC